MMLFMDMKQIYYLLAHIIYSPGATKQGVCSAATWDLILHVVHGNFETIFDSNVSNRKRYTYLKDVSKPHQNHESLSF